MVALRVSARGRRRIEEAPGWSRRALSVARCEVSSGRRKVRQWVCDCAWMNLVGDACGCCGALRSDSYVDVNEFLRMRLSGLSVEASIDRARLAVLGGASVRWGSALNRG